MDTMEKPGRAEHLKEVRVKAVWAQEAPGPRAWSPCRAAIRFVLPGRRRRRQINAGSRKTKVAPTKAKLSRPPEHTFEEINYLKHLIEQRIPVCVKLSDNEQVCGTIEYFDHRFIRVTRQDEPNVFIFKHDIKYLFEAS